MDRKIRRISKKSIIHNALLKARQNCAFLFLRSEGGVWGEFCAFWWWAVSLVLLAFLSGISYSKVRWTKLDYFVTFLQENERIMV